jgi:DNA-binding transcriptional regulator YiaG
MHDPAHPGEVIPGSAWSRLCVSRGGLAPTDGQSHAGGASVATNRAGPVAAVAREAIDQLASHSRTVCAVALTTDLNQLATALAEMNVALRQRPRRFKEAVDIAALRADQGLSQREFADLLGLDVRTLQNWEQGRNRPDAAAVTPMRLFALAPAFVEDALTELVTP